MPTAEIQKMYDELTPQGQELFENLKKAVGIHYENDPSIPYFLGGVSIMDRMEKFAPKLTDAIRQAAHESRTDAVKAGEATMSQVVEKGMTAATKEMTATHAADIHIVKDEAIQTIRDLRAESAAVIRQAQPPTKNWRWAASAALIAQVGLLGAVGFAGWWYRDHQASETTAWGQTVESKQAAEFYQIIKENIPDPQWLSSAPAYTQLRDVIRWASSGDGVLAWKASKSKKK